VMSPAGLVLASLRRRPPGDITSRARARVDGKSREGNVRRYFVDIDTAPAVGQTVVLDLEQSRHLRTVMRAENGDAVELTDGRGHVLRGVLVGGGKKDAQVEITGVEEATGEVAPPLLRLACAVVKGKRFEFAVEKAVEIGVHALAPLRCEHGVIDPRDGKLDRWRGLLTAALKQSGRCHLPRLEELTDPAGALDEADGPVYFGAAPGDLVGEKPLNPTAAAAQAARLKLEGHPAPSSLTLMIGPEGGWSAGELKLLAARDVIPLVLGPHVLRTETAAVVGLAALQQIRRAWLA
jgi:16S rRNA (uracil1498-N3)-methyltransferase